MSGDGGRTSSYQRNGLTFDVTDAGPADGTPVVLLHGFPTDRTSWRHVEPLLHEAGMRTYAPDQRGYSPGARPGGRTAYRMEQLVADVVALADAAGHERVHVVGHDWGGGIAWLLAANHPDRVASLTALSTPHPRAMTQALRGEQALRSWYMAAFQLPYLPEAFLGTRFRDALRGSGLPAEDLERYAARLGSRAALAGPINWYRAIPLSRIRARRVTVPTTYVWGSRDFALGRRAAELTADYVRGPYEFVELDAGHWLPETRAHECADAIIARSGAGQGPLAEEQAPAR